MKKSDIKISEELEQFSKLTGKHQRREFENKNMCNSCNQFATKLVGYRMGDSQRKITRIERYCEKHFELIINR